MNKAIPIRRKIRQPFETAAFLLFKALVPLLPRSGVVGLARLTARLTWLLPLKGKQMGLKNLDAVYADTKTVAEKRKILIRSFATFTQTMLDVIWFSRNAEKRIRQYVKFEPGPLNNSLFEDKPLICITAHMGSWELLGQTTALMGADLASIGASIKNPTIDRIMVKLRQRTGQTVIPRKGALRTLIARLRKNGKAAFVLDQQTRTSNGGIEVDLLGLPMPVSSAPAALAYRTGTGIVIGFCLPEPKGRYRIHIQDAITPPPYDKDRNMDEVVLQLTQQIQDCVSTEIHKHPEFWLWSYKHWRRTPGKHYPEHYPTY